MSSRGKGVIWRSWKRRKLTARDNNAIELYKRGGFEFEELTRHAVQVDGVNENVVLMAALI